MRKSTGIIFVTICQTMWGFVPIFWKQIHGVNSIYLLLSRVYWSMLLCAVFLLATRRFGEVRALWHDRKSWRFLLLCGVVCVINWGSYIIAVNGGHIIDASLAYYIAPILAIFAGRFVFHEHLTRLQWASAAFAGAGILVCIVLYRTIPYLALIIAVSFVAYGAMKKKVSAEADVSLFIESLAVAPVALIVTAVMDARGMGCVGVLHGAEYLWIPATGLATVLPLLFFSRGIKVVPYSLYAMIMYINPTLQLLCGVVLYHEAFTKANALLFAFVGVAIALYFLSLYRVARQVQHAQ
ncbi:MAG: EamA family transporter RarD [Oscillospiraceae bacterium]|nr:EamA family transporter RarD [Oscillospiraceae bacterium]